MKVVRFKTQGREGYGYLRDGFVNLLNAPPWHHGSEIISSHLLSDGILLPPCQPSKIIALAINYPGVTGQCSAVTEPKVFFKAPSSLIYDGDDIIAPFRDMKVWGECELGVVISRRLKDATVEEASSAIFGYTVANDVSCDNVHDWDHHLARSKGVDTFCAVGPWIDLEFDPMGKSITGFQNGKLIRKGSCDQRLWAEPSLLVWLSQWITLEPGDLILTGAPSRVQEKIYLRDGDNYSCSIEGLGQIANTFRVK